MSIHTSKIKHRYGACIRVCVCMYTSMQAYAYITSFGRRKYNNFMLSLVVINVVFNITEYNVSESVETVILHIVANGTSSFDYTVTLMLTNINTGE